ncbi:MAG TPA: UDP-N-acetylglucosamine 1-carboxyvinyltransferase [Candidatus Dormibacteraeota bacterium]|jgi:UDP-N-acetylglucosamine 1-carboxyvinyltransferase|nr:UDP-N-acetylglucosamine 1-carboxyvinyltransferase [Candidatus Dormibacteraeota bacterium]
MTGALRVEGGLPLRGSVRVSGSKNAALPILAATLLTDQPCRITNVPGLADVETALAILRAVGADVRREPAAAPGAGDGTGPDGGAPAVRVEAGGAIGAEVPAAEARQMRASILFLGPLLARTGRAVVPKPGGDDIGMRRIDQHLAGLAALGAAIEERDGAIICSAGRLRGADIQLDMPTVTGTENLLMAACLAEGRTTILNAAREPHVQDLARALGGMGARIEGAGTDRIEIEGVDRLGGLAHRVVPDYLEAGTYAIAVAATGGEVRLEDAPVQDLQPLLVKLRKAGVEIVVAGDALTVGRAGPLRPVDLITWTHPGFATDLQPQYTALMTQAEGETVVQEFLFEDRFNYVDQLIALGARIEPLVAHGRGVRVHGPSRLAGTRLAIPDIRAGAAIVIAALCADGVSEIEGVGRLDRGYESLPGKLAGLGARLIQVNSGN